MNARYVECQHCGDLIWEPTLTRHERKQSCKEKAALHALHQWWSSLGGDPYVEAAAFVVLTSKAERLFGKKFNNGD